MSSITIQDVVRSAAHDVGVLYPIPHNAHIYHSINEFLNEDLTLAFSPPLPTAADHEKRLLAFEEQREVVPLCLQPPTNVCHNNKKRPRVEEADAVVKATSPRKNEEWLTWLNQSA